MKRILFSTIQYYGLQFTLRNIIKNDSLVQILKTNLNHDNERYIMKIDDKHHDKRPFDF